jgi:ABC-type multidrug transport system fused ATPase/permease subunit
MPSGQPDRPIDAAQVERSVDPMNEPTPSVTVWMRRAARLLNRRERVRFAILAAVTPISAIGETAAVAAMLPFLSVLVDTSSIRASSLTGTLLARFGVTQREDIVMFMGGASCLVLFLTNALIVATLWLMLRFSWSLHHRLSTTLLRKYLHKPYTYFLSTNSAGMAGNLVLQVARVTDGILVPALQAFGRGTAAAALIVFVGVAEPLLALAALGLISGIYSLFYLFLARRKLRDLGERRVHNSKAMMQVISEAFGGIKDVKLLHAEDAFADVYRPLSQTLARDQILETLIATTPRYVVEAVSFGGIILVTLAFSAHGGADGRVVPLLGMFAFAGYRLMPSIQHIFGCLVQIRTNLPAFESLHADLSVSAADAEAEPARGLPPRTEAAAGQIVPTWTIDLRQVTFRYPGAKAAALEDFDLSLKAKATTGIVGPTGSGKTTVVDLLLGLLRPGQGELWIDGVCLDASGIERWQQSIGYVPQHIYLSDSSIVRNVAFGVPEQEIDRARVEEACRSAQIHDFIVQNLSDGYDTQVGERGIRLSGGERQRLGIARALYRRPEVLILDEATSALDRKTEAEVMVAIHNLAGKKTPDLDQ